MAYYPQITINPFSSIQAMFSLLSSSAYNGKIWQAQSLGDGNSLKKVSQKEPLLYDWILLVKVLKTLESYSKDNDYDTLSPQTPYRIILKTDMAGSIIDNTSFRIEVNCMTIEVHSNYMYYKENTFEKVRLQEVRKIAKALDMMRGDVEEMVNRFVSFFFFVNDSGNIFCSSKRLQEIYQKCLSISQL